MEIEDDGVFFDSGASLIYLPAKSYDKVLAKITDGKECAQADNFLWACNCTGAEDPTFPTIYILLGSYYNQHWFELEGQDYLYTLEGYCII